MSALRSLKSDLLDRRMLVILAVLCVALVAAIAYTVLDGNGTSNEATTASAPAPAPVSRGPNLSVAQAPTNRNAAVSETTVGTRYQHKHGSRNPFTPLIRPRKAVQASTSLPSSSSTPSSSSSEGGAPSGSSESASGSTPGSTSPTKPSASKPTKPKRVHKFVAEVGFQFGPVTPPDQPSQLVPYTGVKQHEGVPTGKSALLVFAGLDAARKSAIFTLNSELILKGPATCLPSTTQCEAIKLEAGQTEELGNLDPTGAVTTYELVLQSVNWHEEIVTVTAKTSRRHHRHR
jgi:hypothetical protein